MQRLLQVVCVLLFGVMAGLPSAAVAAEYNAPIDMRAKGGTTFYVPGHIDGLGELELMVDTGSGYLTINEEILATLQGSGQARFVRHMRGRLANGSEYKKPARLAPGEQCAASSRRCSIKARLMAAPMALPCRLRQRPSSIFSRSDADRLGNRRFAHRLESRKFGCGLVWCAAIPPEPGFGRIAVTGRDWPIARRFRRVDAV